MIIINFISKKIAVEVLNLSVAVSHIQVNVMIIEAILTLETLLSLYSLTSICPWHHANQITI